VEARVFQAGQHVDGQAALIADAVRAILGRRERDAGVGGERALRCLNQRINYGAMLPTVHRIFSDPMSDRYRGDGRALLGAEDNLRSIEGVRYLFETPRAKYR
jgi:hypothetical protein